MADAPKLVRVAVPVPLADGFDYRCSGEDLPPLGSRVRVPFGRGERVGIVLAHPASSQLPEAKLKSVLEALDPEPLIDTELLGTLIWAADYYHHPIGEVVKHALPGFLRKGGAAEAPEVRGWKATELGLKAARAGLSQRAAQQIAALAALADGTCIAVTDLKRRGCKSDALRRLAEKGWIETCAIRGSRAEIQTAREPDDRKLTADQALAVATIDNGGGKFDTFLLHGATGSGKTEVFLRLIRGQLERGRQSLLLVPEIGLTPQLVARLRERFGDELVVIHSALSDNERAAAWRSARLRTAKLIVGTRSAVFAPLPAAGLIIIDEEHDSSYKQQQGFRYSARDLAVVRARRLGIPILLASATPSLESLRNARNGRYRLLTMPKRIGAAGAPKFRVIDLTKHASRQELSTPLIAAMNAHLERGNQVLLFLNRRGFAPVLFCSQCQTIEECDRCDARLTVHARRGVLICHHCGHERPLHWSCERCGSERIGVGAGTQRVSDELQSLYPDRKIARLDRDVTVRRGALSAVLTEVERGDTQIIVGTQMLTKGHDFPRVTLVGILNADQGLFGTDFRSDERLAQTIVQVGGRAGRRDQPGEVIIQTHFPAHPLLGSLLTQDYDAFATLALEERRLANWPPFSHLALWRAEAHQRQAGLSLLGRLRAHAAARAGGVQILGPAAATMERRGGRYRAQLLFQSSSRAALHALINECLIAMRDWRESRRVRWSIDVDPAEL
jgi:primosomal protein N' (replication factor Y)